MKSLQALEALFQDLVYHQLDAGLPAHCAYLLGNVTRKVCDALILQPIPAHHTERTLCAAVFGFLPGQALPLYGGRNKFSSAVAAARLLQTYLEVADLIAVLACMEATIPFCAPDAQCQSTTNRLALRMRHKPLPTGW